VPEVNLSLLFANNVMSTTIEYMPSVAIIGAGPAGLTAAYQLGKAGTFAVDVFEKDRQYVGGISRTEQYKGFHFDIGGHRFFSKSKEVEDFWTEILGDDLLERPRSSRIYYSNRFFNYPLLATEALRKLGVIESFRCVLSYIKAKIFPVNNPQNFEDWISNHFGHRLFSIFFKTYTEKVWGINCKEISADWAAQRIKGLSLTSAVKNAVLPARQGKVNQIKTLIDSFRYPKYGPGQMWETCKIKAEALGINVLLGQDMGQLIQTEDGKWMVVTASNKQFGPYDHVISSAPLNHLVKALGSAAPPSLQKAASNLSYRDFISVILILKDEHSFNDNWIYVHDPSVKVGRIQNFKSWSPYMVPDDKMVCYGLEYFCFEGDNLWTSSDQALAELGKKELEKIGLGKAGDVLDSYVVRQAKAYPVYDQDYQSHIDIIKEALQKFRGVILVGRNGMHKYNNQDHSMMTAMLAVKNIIAGKQIYDLWNVNQDAEYHEGGTRGAEEGGRKIPKRLVKPVTA
jgi:protoporphyrinogen oxidase